MGVWGWGLGGVWCDVSYGFAGRGLLRPAKRRPSWKLEWEGGVGVILSPREEGGFGRRDSDVFVAALDVRLQRDLQVGLINLPMTLGFSGGKNVKSF
jgi:hypothetical protein